MSIRGFEACRARLGELLAAAEQVRASGTPEEAGALALELIDFFNQSRPADPLDKAEEAAVAKLDLLATRLADEMNALAIRKATGGVVVHAAEIAAIGQTLGEQTLANVSAAKRIRLTPVRDLIDRMTDTVAAVKVAAKSLDAAEPDEARIQREIATLAERFQALVAATRQAADPAGRR